jgi:predicted nucleic acid-binding Zn ribbon protein
MIEMADDTDTRLAVHEAICTERYGNIKDSLEKGSNRMQKIEYLIYAVMVLVLLGPGAAAEFLKRFFG